MRWLIALLALLPTVASSQAVCSTAAQSETTCSAVEQSITITSACECVASVAAPAGPFGGHATLTDGLVSYWPLDEESGTRVDIVGTNDLTDNNTVGFASVTGPPNFPAGKAASFVAANSEYLSIADNASVSLTGSTTWVAWVKPASAGTTRPVIAKRQTSIEFQLLVDNSNTIAAYIEDSVAGSATFSGSAVVSAGSWHLLIWWYDASDKKIYGLVDNANQQVSSALPNSPRDSNQAFEIGRSAAAFHYGGEIGPVLLYSRVLTAQERTDLYAAGAGLFYED